MKTSRPIESADRPGALSSADVEEVPQCPRERATSERQWMYRYRRPAAGRKRKVRVDDANLRSDGKHGGQAHNSLGRILDGARTRVYTRHGRWDSYRILGRTRTDIRMQHARMRAYVHDTELCLAPEY